MSVDVSQSPNHAVMMGEYLLRKKMIVSRFQEEEEGFDIGIRTPYCPIAAANEVSHVSNGSMALL